MFSGFSSAFRLGRRNAEVTITAPTQITALQIWYDASVSSTTNFNVAPANAADVSQWKDKSGTGHNANQSGNASVKPNWYSNVQNGLGVIRFNGTSESLNINPIAFMQNLPGFSLYVVARLNNATGVRPLCGSDQDGLKIGYNGTNWTVKTSGGTGTSTVTGETSSFHTFGLIYDGTQPTNVGKLRFRYDANEQTLSYTGTVGTTTSGIASTFYVGQDTTSNFLQGEIGEMLMFTRTLNSGEIMSVEDYLRTHWNI